MRLARIIVALAILGSRDARAIADLWEPSPASIAECAARVRRASNAGHWSVSDALFEKADVNPSNWCSGIQFLDQSDGWVSGWRTLYATDDGGGTWRAMPALPLGPEEQVRELVRLSKQVAWAASRQRVFRTENGGRSWAVVHLDEDSPRVAWRKDGRPVLVRAKPGPGPESWVPLLDDSATVVGRTDVMSKSLALWSGGELVRSGPPVTPSTGTRVTLTGVSGSYGWVDRSIFRSDDSAKSWKRVGELPFDVAALVPVNAELTLVKTSDGALHASTDGGRSWAPASLSDEIEWGKRTGEERVRADQRIECVLRAPRVVLTVEYGVSGCFGGSKNELVIESETGGAMLRGAFDRHSRESTDRDKVERRLDPGQTRAALEKLVSAATRDEQPSRCSSTNHWFSRVSFACGDAPTSTLEFETNDCASRGALEVVGASTSTGGRSQGDYRRAIGVGEVAEALLR